MLLRRYRRKLKRWILITKEYLPPNEQALRGLEQQSGEAEIELEEIDDSRYDRKDGIELLLKDLEESFGERELFRQGGIIREFEQIGRLQGESVAAFKRLVERKLKHNRVLAYPEQARVVKLLEGLRLGERSVSSVLLAAGNQYDMTKVLGALRIQYPAGLSITGLPRPRQDPRPARGWATAPSSRSSLAGASTRSTASREAQDLGRRHWNTDWNEAVEEDPDQGHDDQADALPSVPEGGEGDDEDQLPVSLRMTARTSPTTRRTSTTTLRRTTRPGRMVIKAMLFWH